MAIRFRGLDAPFQVVYWKGGSAPVPDPNVQVAAETAANRYNVVGPTGSQRWTQGERYVSGYDQSGKPIYANRETQTTELSPTAQRQFDMSNQIAEQMLGGAEGKIGDFADSNFEYDRSGFDRAPYSTDRSGYDKTPFSYDQATPAAAQASYKRQIALLQPEFDREDRAFEQRMSNAGIPIGSEAYNDAVQQRSQDRNSTLNDLAGRAEEMGTGLALSERQQRQGEAGEAASQGLQQRQQRQAEAGTQSGLNLSERQQRYNELAAALGGQQVMPVSAFSGGPGQPVDVAGAYQQQNMARLANSNASNSFWNSLLGMGGQLGASAITRYSDERVKKDIEPVGELPGGEGVYEYRYKWEDDDAPKQTGVIAQEVERTHPDVVTRDEHGIRKVDYRRLIAHALAEAA